MPQRRAGLIGINRASGAALYVSSINYLGASMNRCLAILIAVLGIGLSAPLSAQVPGEKMVDGLIVRVGLASTREISSHAARHGETAMHAGPKRNHDRHVVISVSEATSGNAIEVAQVRLNISRDGVDHLEQTLAPMPMLANPSYGGWVDLRARGTYRFAVEISRAGNRKSSTYFDWKNP